MVFIIINKFREEFYFLSNFSNCVVKINDIIFKNTEAAFQSFKDLNRQSEFSNLSSSQAKRLGRKVELRKDWENIKLDIMYLVVKAKFEQNKYLKEQLLATGEEQLIEGNNWRDRYWGIYNNIGQNNLGKILMKVRSEL